jgi:gliding motility-associated lipoprotein GldB
MKNFFLTSLIVLTLFSCDKKSKTEKAVEEIPIEIKVARFDQLFYETNPQDLTKLKKQFPYLFPVGNADTVWTNKMQNPLWRELHDEVQKKFPNTNTLQTDIEKLVQHIKYYYPNSKTPKLITLISEMDYNSKAIYTDSLALVSLELYLGKDHKFYQNEFPDFIKQNFEPNQILPDLVTSFGIQKIAYPRDKSLLSLMIYAGKELYLKDKLIPETADEYKIGYSKEQLQFCQENEAYMWSFFIENNLLYDSDSKLPSRFINPAPFSKFYLEIDNQTPGRVGAWLGWQIVRSYSENNDKTSLQDLLKMDAKELCEKSRYKPKK